MHYINKILVFYLLLFLPFLTGCEEDPYYHTITFEKKSSMPGTGRASAVAFAINGKGYVTLGRGTNISDLWEYNPVDDSWLAKKAFPGLNRVKAIGAVVNNKAYVGLGFVAYGGALTETNFLTDLWCYDPSTNDWTDMAGFPGKGTDGCGYFVLNNKIYVFCGYAYLTPTFECWAYDPELNRWELLDDFTGTIRFSPVACSDGERAFFGNGFNGQNINDWWEYKAADDTWLKRRSMPTKGRINALALTVNKRFFVTTGRNFNGEHNGGGVMSDILEYDPIKNKWHDRGTMPDGGRENAVSFVIDNKAYIGFGENDEGMLNDMYSFEP